MNVRSEIRSEPEVADGGSIAEGRSVDRSRPESNRHGSLTTSVQRAISHTRDWLLREQRPDGSWCAELEGDTILESEAVLVFAFLGREETSLARRAAAHLVEKQLPGGGWAMYPGGPMEISGSVKAYFALKLTGHDPESEYMQRARKAIRAGGGADAVNSFTRFFLAFLGQISYDHCPAVPPELAILPKWFPVNLYSISAWSRTIVVPLSIVSALQPVRRIDPSRGIHELFVREPKEWPRLRCPGLPGGTGMFSWDHFFRGVNQILKWGQKYRLMPWRKKAIAAARDWMFSRFENSDGLGAIFPPIIFSLVALRSLGYGDESAPMQECLKQLDQLVIDEPQGDTARLQPCMSPVWDTSIVLRAISASGMRPDHPSISRAVRWLLSKQSTQPGDWTETVDAEPGGWYFEFANEYYPDVDDTVMVLMALQTQFESDVPEVPESDADTDEPASAPDLRQFAARLQETTAAIDRGLRWTLAMQNRDGGWGAFDRDNDRHFLCYVPFADHNAMIDPSTPDLTGRVLEALARLGRRVGDPVVDRAVAYVRSAQQDDGSWFGRWGVNYIYGTWQSLTGLLDVGVSREDPAIVAGVKWLLAHQQACGGWGESPITYERPELRGQGAPTASQTAWALLGLLAAGLEEHPAVIRGIRWLQSMQQNDGTWYEPEFTGTGFPRVFYLRYHYYPIYFPLLALSKWVGKLHHHRNARCVSLSQ